MLPSSNKKSNKKMKKLLTIILFGLATTASADEQIAYLVVCDDDKAHQLISKAIESKLKKANLEVTEKLPKAKLIVYAQKDTNDRVNPEGWSFAISHVSNYATYFVAAKLLDTQYPEVKQAEPAIMDMLKHDGFLTYINVGHIDKLNEQTVSKLSEGIVQEFAKRVVD
jgi:hypothetical protein